jgi:hypothetical protein
MIVGPRNRRARRKAAGVDESSLGEGRFVSIGRRCPGLMGRLVIAVLAALAVAACTGSKPRIDVDLGVAMSQTAIASMDNTDWDQIRVTRKGDTLVELKPFYVLPSTGSFLAQGRLEQLAERRRLVERIFHSGPTIVNILNRKSGDGRLECEKGRACIEQALAALDAGGQGHRTKVNLLLFRDTDEPGGMLVALRAVAGRPQTGVDLHVIFDSEEFDALLKPAFNSKIGSANSTPSTNPSTAIR